MNNNTHTTQSWAQVVSTNKAAVPISLTSSTTERQEFKWRLVKKGRLRPRVSMSARHECAASHCSHAVDSCKQRECIFQLGRQFVDLKAENVALSSSFEARLSDIEGLRREIFETCNTEDLFAAEMEVSRIAMLTTIAKSKKLMNLKASECDCSSCQLPYHQKENAILNEKLSAAQRRLTALREFLVANDKETKYRTSSSFCKSNKYFTPVGSSKAKGVSALRPTLQMQSSYDVAALTTNTMVSRPLKMAWKDKPKPIRVMEAKLKLDEDGKGVDNVK